MLGWLKTSCCAEDLLSSQHWLVHARTHACRRLVLLIAGRGNDTTGQCEPGDAWLRNTAFSPALCSVTTATKFFYYESAHAAFCLLRFQSLPSAPRTVPACTESSLTRQSAMCSGTAGTVRPAAISAPLDWRMTARRVSACGLTRCQNARLKVGIATGKCCRSLG
jgi:hypothetical protein